jgi:outer membrane protein OmpA-like peptidoglycan-associated protein
MGELVFFARGAMGFKKLLIGAASALVLTAGVANADYDRDGWYVGLEGAWVSVPDSALLGSGLNPIEFDAGWGALGTVGYALSNSNWRIEGELGYRQNDVVATLGRTAIDGELTEWSMFVNAVYDFRFSSDRLGISVGAGIGMDDPRLEFGSVKAQSWEFAAQGLVGLTYRLTQHTDLMINYRYTWIRDADMTLSFVGLPVETESELELTKHSISIGLRYGYNDPPAPPVVVPPPVVTPPPPKTFIIFFGFNKCNITAEADAVLSEAAAAAKSGGSASVRIVGHTDTVGSNSYNQKLSECRANAAKSNLVGKGVSEGSISTSGKGESELMVQTGDSVKEPQNRRATVDLN